MFHLRAKIIGRSTGRSAAGASAYRTGGRSAAASAAYRAGGKLRDPKSGRMFDYSQKATIDAEGFGILHTEIMLPVGAPGWMSDRQALIDAVEARETRADAQLFREIEISLPRELTFEQQRELIRDFVQAQFVSRGMIADLAIHDEEASDGGRNPHAHILLTMRSVSEAGFGAKVRAWNSPALLREWREAWADVVNERLAQYGHERRIDHRSHIDRDIDLVPDTYLGPSKAHDFEGSLSAERQESRNAGKQENIERIQLNPERLINAVAREKATFTAADLSNALRRATGLERDTPEHQAILAASLGSSALMPIASDQRGQVRYATRDMVACEAEMASAALSLARRSSCEVSPPPAEHLSVEQAQAYRHAAHGPDLVLIAGSAGAGKTTALADIAAGFIASGHRVRGAALAGVAARNLATEAGIPASTLASLLNGWDRRDDNGRPHPSGSLEQGDVVIVDEAGLIGSRDIRRLLTEADRARAKVILVGDSQQLQAIEAGAAFRSLSDTHGCVELRDVRRQRQDWQRAASQFLAQKKGAEAIAAYRAAGCIHAADSTAEAMDQLVSQWMADGERQGSQLILAHSRTDVAELNNRVRTALRTAGRLGRDVKVTIKEQLRDEAGEIVQRARRATFAQGDQVLFTRNDRTLGVQNGVTGEILALEPSGQMKVRLADGKDVAFSSRDYPHLTLGYAMTIHKAQGATYDRAYVLATAGLDAHIGYVALTRHRESVGVFHGRDQFRQPNDLTAAFMRQRPKDTTLDYLQRARTERVSGDVAQGKGQTDVPRHAPMSAAERIRQNVSARRQALSRGNTRDRSYGD